MAAELPPPTAAMHFKMCKKVAQVTKVVASLHQKLEQALEEADRVKAQHAAELQQKSTQLRETKEEAEIQLARKQAELKSRLEDAGIEQERMVRQHTEQIERASMEAEEAEQKWERIVEDLRQQVSASGGEVVRLKLESERSAEIQGASHASALKRLEEELAAERAENERLQQAVRHHEGDAASRDADLDSNKEKLARFEDSIRALETERDNFANELVRTREELARAQDQVAEARADADKRDAELAKENERLVGRIGELEAKVADSDQQREAALKAERDKSEAERKRAQDVTKELEAQQTWWKREQGKLNGKLEDQQLSHKTAVGILNDEVAKLKKQLADSEAERIRTFSEAKDSTFGLKAAEERHAAAIARMEQDHLEQMEKVMKEVAGKLAKTKEEHAAALGKLSKGLEDQTALANARSMEVVELKQKMAVAEKISVESKAKANRLERDMANLKNDFASLEEERDALQARCAELEKRVQELEGKVAISNEEHSSIVAAKDKELKASGAELKDAKKKLARLEKKLKATEAELKKVSGTVAAAETAAKDAERRRDEAVQETDSLRIRLDTVQYEHRSAIQAEVQAATAQARQEVRIAKQQIEELRLKGEAAEKSAKAAQRKFKQNEEEMKSRIEAISGAKSGLETQVEEFEQRVKALQERIEKQLTELGTTHRALDASYKECERIETEGKQLLKQTKETMTKEHEENVVLIQAAHTQKLAETRTRFAEQMNDIRIERDVVKGELADAMAKLAANATKMEEDEEMLNEQKRRVKTLMADTTRLEHKLGAAHKMCERAELDAIASKRAAEELLSSAEMRAAEMLQREREQQAELEHDLRDTIRCLEEDKEELRREMQRQGDSAAYKYEHRESLESDVRLIRSLMKETDELRGRLETAEERTEMFQTELFNRETQYNKQFGKPDPLVANFSRSPTNGQTGRRRRANSNVEPLDVGTRINSGRMSLASRESTGSGSEPLPALSTKLRKR